MVFRRLYLLFLLLDRIKILFGGLLFLRGHLFLLCFQFFLLFVLFFGFYVLTLEHRLDFLFRGDSFNVFRRYFLGVDG